MSAYTEFFLGSARSVVQLQLIEIAHPLFSQTYYLVRNARGGITVTHEDSLSKDYTYYPMKITQLGARENLDTGVSISFGDIGTVISKEIDLMVESSFDLGFKIRPTVKYRVYRSDDLTSPLYGPLTLQVKSMSFNRKGATFQAKPPQLNILTTGELYTLDRFPMLRGFL